VLRGDESEPFALWQLLPTEWVVCDLRVPSDDARCVIAHIRLDAEDDLVDVRWHEECSRPTRYLSVDAVLDDLREEAFRQRGRTRPIEIPHFAPPRVA